MLLKDFTKNYKLIDSLVISSSEFMETSKTTFFPIVIALYKKDERREPFHMKKKRASFEEALFCLSNYGFDFGHHLFGGDDFQAVQAFGAGSLPAVAAGAVCFDGVSWLAVGAVAVGIRGAHDHDGGSAQTGGQVYGAGIASQAQFGLLEDAGELLEVCPAHQIHGRDFCIATDFGGPLLVHRPAAHQDGDDLPVVELVRQLGEVFGGPALVGPVGADGKYGIGIVHAGACLGKDPPGKVCLPLPRRRER